MAFSLLAEQDQTCYILQITACFDVKILQLTMLTCHLGVFLPTLETG